MGGQGRAVKQDLQWARADVVQAQLTLTGNGVLMQGGDIEYGGVWEVGGMVSPAAVAGEHLLAG